MTLHFLLSYNLTLTLIIDGLSLRRPEFDSTPDHVEIVLDKAALEHVYLGVFWFFRVVTVPAMLHAYYSITGIVYVKLSTDSFFEKPLSKSNTNSGIHSVSKSNRVTVPTFHRYIKLRK